MKIEFCGGSKDGAVLEVHQMANCILRFPINEVFGATVLEPGDLKVELYEYKADGKYHFVGYN